MSITAFRHNLCEGMGSLAAALDKAGLPYHYVDTYHEDIDDFDALGPELLVVMGGAPGVYQMKDYPFIEKEIDIIRARLDRGKAVMGICLGAQMLAKAMGSDVYPGAQGPEKGWFPLTVNDAGMKGPARFLDKSYTSMFHWHGDTFDLPLAANLLASSDKYQNQIFSAGKNVIGLQCHLEITPQILHGWSVSSAASVAKGHLSLDQLRGQTAEYNETLIRQSEKFLLHWLSDIGLYKGQNDA